MPSTIQTSATRLKRRTRLGSIQAPQPDGEIRGLTPPAPGVRIVDCGSRGFRAAWLQYVSQHPDASFFHEPAWGRCVRRTFGHVDRSLLAWRGPRVVGALPLFQMDSVLAGRILVSQPYAIYGGVLASDPAAADAVLAHAAALAGRINARLLELRSKKAAHDAWPRKAAHVTFRRALPHTIGEIDTYLPRKARAAARGASQKHDPGVEFGHHLLPAVWRLYSRSMRRLGSINYPLRFFEALVEECPERVVAQIVRVGGRPAAGLVSFLHRKTFMPYFAGVDERLRIYGLSHFLYAQSMRWAVEHGYEVYDFGRSRVDNKGAYEFKRLCGFEPEPLEYQVYVPPGAEMPDLAPGSARWARARRLWQFLPLAVSRPLGAWLSGSIPG